MGSPPGGAPPSDCARRKVKDMVWFTDFSGNRIELVVRPLNSGWRYFPSRDAGVRGLSDVILRSIDIEKDLSIWSGIFGAQVSDWAGDAAYLRFDDAHHRIALFPATRPGILAVEYAVEDVNLLMRNYYVLQGSASRRSARAGTPSRVRADFSDVRGPRIPISASWLKDPRRGGAAPARQFPAGPRTVQLGKRMQDR